MRGDSTSIKALYESGAKVPDIAKIFKIAKVIDVYKILHEAGTKMRKPGKPRKLPRKEELRNLYVTEKKTTVEIGRMFSCTHKTVLAALDRARIPIRKSGPIKKDICSECWRPVFRIHHKKFNCWYGTLCKFHRTRHYADLNKWITRRTRNIPPEKWLYEIDVPEKYKSTIAYRQKEEEKCLRQARRELANARSYLKKLGRSQSQSGE